MAEGDGIEVTRGQVDQEVAMFLKENNHTLADIPEGKVPSLLTTILDNLILNQLFLKRAEALKIQGLEAQENLEFDAFSSRFANRNAMDDNLTALGLSEAWIKQRIHEKIIRIRVLEKEGYDNTPPTQDEMLRVYKSTISHYQNALEIRVSRILIHADSSMTDKELAYKKKLIEEAAAQIKHGEDFAHAAAEFSEDVGSRATGGDLGYLTQGQSEAGFDDVAFRMKVGETSPIFQTPLGYQIIRVTDIHPAGILSFSEVQSSISDAILKGRHRADEEAYNRKLLADANITYHFKRVEINESDEAAR